MVVNLALSHHKAAKHSQTATAAIIPLVLLLFLVPECSNAQMWSGINNPLGLVSSCLPALGNKTSHQTESSLAWLPFTFVPAFGGELRARGMLVSLEQGKFVNNNTGISLNFVNDLGFEKQGFLVETMARTQLKRFGLRAHYDAYSKDLIGKKGQLQWPEWRFGGDLDLMDYAGIRFGFNVDMLWKQPTFSYSLPTGVNELIVWPRPITVGVHAAYNPSDCESISPSVEIRYRYPAVTGSLVKELEIAVGAKTPRSSRGTSGLRGGWRHTSMEFDVGERQLNVTWSAFFAEYVCFF
jgi:hypothetical protein